MDDDDIQRSFYYVFQSFLEVFWSLTKKKNNFTDLFRADPDIPQLLLRQQYSFFTTFLTIFTQKLFIAQFFSL